jgi:hypothetical protein
MAKLSSHKERACSTHRAVSARSTRGRGVLLIARECKVDAVPLVRPARHNRRPCGRAHLTIASTRMRVHRQLHAAAPTRIHVHSCAHIVHVHSDCSVQCTVHARHKRQRQRAEQRYSLQPPRKTGGSKQTRCRWQEPAGWVSSRTWLCGVCAQQHQRQRFAWAHCERTCCGAAVSTASPSLTDKHACSTTHGLASTSHGAVNADMATACSGYALLAEINMCTQELRSNVVTKGKSSLTRVVDAVVLDISPPLVVAQDHKHVERRPSTRSGPSRSRGSGRLSARSSSSTRTHHGDCSECNSMPWRRCSLLLAGCSAHRPHRSWRAHVQQIRLRVSTPGWDTGCCGGTRSVSSKPVHAFPDDRPTGMQQLQRVLSLSLSFSEVR